MGDRLKVQSKATKDYDILYRGSESCSKFINITYGAEVFKLLAKYQKVKYGCCTKVHIAVCEEYQCLPGMCKHYDLGLH